MRLPPASHPAATKWLLLASAGAALFLAGYLTRELLPAKPALSSLPPRADAHQEGNEVSAPVPKPSSGARPFGSKTEYLLAFELPEQRQKLDKRIASSLAKSIEKTEFQYKKTLAELGLPEAEVDQAIKHSWKVFRASAELEAMQQQYLMAKSEYDKRMRRLLSGESYAKYRYFEDSKQILFEYNNFVDFLTKRGLPDFSVMEDDVKNAIYESRAFTMKFSHGPYDDMPDVGLGRDAAIAHFKQRVARIQTTSAALPETPAGSRLSADCLSALKSYYVYCTDAMNARITRYENDARLQAENQSQLVP